MLIVYGRPCFGKQQCREKHNVTLDIIRNFSHLGHGWKILFFLHINTLAARIIGILPRATYPPPPPPPPTDCFANAFSRVSLLYYYY